MTYKGKIFKIPFPFTDLSGFKATKNALTFGEHIELKSEIFNGEPLPFDSKLHIDKTYLLSKEIIRKELSSVSDAFLERIMRQIVLRDTRKHYEIKHKTPETFSPGDRISYAGRVYDEREVTTLVDSSLDFWLTTGRYAEKFEKEFAAFLGVQHCEMRATGKGFRVVPNRNVEMLKCLTVENSTSQPLNPSTALPLLPVTDRIMNDTFWIGVYPGMTEEMIGYMVETIKMVSR